jgi:hypothetical protein
MKMEAAVPPKHHIHQPYYKSANIKMPGMFS